MVGGATVVVVVVVLVLVVVLLVVATEGEFVGAFVTPGKGILN